MATSDKDKTNGASSAETSKSPDQSEVTGKPDATKGDDAKKTAPSAASSGIESEAKTSESGATSAPSKPSGDASSAKRDDTEKKEPSEAGAAEESKTPKAGPSVPVSKPDTAPRPAQAAKPVGTESKAGPASRPDTERDAPRSARGRGAGAMPPPARRSGFFGHLTAGIVGGLVALAAFGFGWFGSPPGPDGDVVETLQERVKALEGLGVRIDEAEGGLAAQKAALEALKGTPPENGEPIGSLGELAGRIGDIAKKTETRTTALEEARERQDGQIATLRSEGNGFRQEAARLSADVVALKATASRAVGRRDELASRLDGALTRLAALEGQVVELAARDSSALRHAGLTIAFANLRGVVDRGSAYRAEFDLLQQLVPSGTDLSILEANADRGVATTGTLARSFRQAAHDVLDAEAKSESDGMVDRILANARSLVKVRRTVPGEGDDTSNLLARMSQGLDAGNLNTVIAEGDKIAGPAAAALKPWLDSAKARAAVEKSLRGLQGSLVGGVHDRKPDGKAR